MSNEFFKQIILGNSVASWLICLGVIVFFFLFSKGISKLLAFISVKYLTKVVHNNFRETIEKEVVRPFSKFLFWMVTISALTKLNFPEALNFTFMKIPFSAILTKVGAGWLIILFFNFLIGIMYLAATIFQRSANRRGDRSMLQLVGLLSDLVKAILIVLAILVLLKTVLSISLSSFATSLGLVTAALALAAKDTVENVICSIIILLDKPFFIGDYISVDGVKGNVEKIGLRRTILRTDNKTQESIPNRNLTGNKLENVSNQTLRRFTQNLLLVPETPPEKIDALVKDIREILASQAPNPFTSSLVFFKTTGSVAHTVYMEYYVSISMSYNDFCMLNQKVNLEITKKMQEEGIEMVRQLNTN